MPNTPEPIESSEKAHNSTELPVRDDDNSTEKNLLEGEQSSTDLTESGTVDDQAGGVNDASGNGKKLKLTKASELAEETMPHVNQLTTNDKVAQVDVQWKHFEWQETPIGPDIHEGKIFLIKRYFSRDQEYIKTMIVLKSSLIKTAMRSILGKLDSLTLVGEPEVNVQTLWHFREELNSYRGMQLDTEEAQHVEILIDYLRTNFDEINHILHSMIAQDEISYDYIWAIFRPDSIAVMPTHDSLDDERCFRIDNVHKPVTYGMQEKDKFVLEGHYFEYVGNRIGYAEVKVPIEVFRGTKKINTLPAYPLQFSESKDSMIRRGKLFVELKGKPQSSWYYDDRPALIPEKGSEKSKRDTDDGETKFRICYVRGRVIVDRDGYRREYPGCTPKVKTVLESSHNFTEEDYLITSPIVGGFDLKRKQWIQLLLSCVQPIRYQKDAWESLELKKQYKAYIHCLVHNHINQKVRAASEGSYILLTGDSGCGKTMTVESICEEHEIPLYKVTAGELSSTEDISLSLDNIFYYAHSWKACLFIDEADELLAEKEKTKFVGAFLAKVERTSALLFLACNITRNFSQAMLTRMHIGIRFESLTAQMKERILVMWIAKWKNNIKPADIHILSHDLEGLNGRDIKNFVQLAGMVTEAEGKILRVRDIKEAVEQRFQFQLGMSREEYRRSRGIA